MSKLVVLELNEVNFDFVQEYIRQGKLPAFAQLLDRYGFAETTSEGQYEKLEPWIQWVTAHSGLAYEEHQVFRLGDIVDREIVQIWEYLEKKMGVTVAAVSPMNASNKTSNSPFFMPDPWTGGRISGPRNLRGLYSAVAEAVNQNATGNMSIAVVRDLLFGLVRHGRFKSLPSYLAYILGFPSGKWRKALILDRLLADLFIRSWHRSKPDFSTVFVNAAAHIQHHYMFSSAAYKGEAKNPKWYVKDSADPVLEAYELYDKIVTEMLQLPDTRLMIMTGLHQDPHPTVTYYYRLKRHAEFLSKLGMVFESVEPRMSRDFLIRFASHQDAEQAQALLASIRTGDGSELFFVENRGKEIFAMLTYPDPIETGFEILIGDRSYASFADDVAFVAIKNGEHNGIGYFLDTGWGTKRVREQFALHEAFDLMVSAVQKSNAIESGA